MANYTPLPIKEEEAEEEEEVKSSTAEKKGETVSAAKNGGSPPPPGWTVEGIPVADSRVMRGHWESGIFSCIGKNDDFYSSDVEGSCEGMSRSFGCSGNILMNEAQREQCEPACDFATHVFCHSCALCQEAREVRRKLPHP